MTKTKTTPCRSSSSHRPGGMATARFTSAEEEQFEDAGGYESQDSQDWPDIENPKQQAATEGEGETSKSVGKTGDQPTGSKGGAPAPPEENPPAPTPSDPKPGTSKDPTDPQVVDPTQDPTQAPTKNPEEETPPQSHQVHEKLPAGREGLVRFSVRK